jgi:hypothetical protein
VRLRRPGPRPARLGGGNRCRIAARAHDRADRACRAGCRERTRQRRGDHTPAWGRAPYQDHLATDAVGTGVADGNTAGSAPVGDTEQPFDRLARRRTGRAADIDRHDPALIGRAGSVPDRQAAGPARARRAREPLEPGDQPERAGGAI